MDDTGNAELNYCYNCMRKLESGQTVCPDCGYDNSVKRDPTDALPEGTMLAGHYLVGKALGQGGFGITYLGLDTSLKKRVAIKEYYPRGVCSRFPGARHVTGVASLSHPEDFQNGLEEFRKEAETLAQISSPNIVRVLTTFRENGTAYIIMEYADGISLSKEVMKNGGRLSWQRVTDLFKDLIRELEKLHEKHLIHRDIKPDNLQIVKDENGKERLVLLDFGTARHFESAEISQTYTAMLTPGYAPAEQYLQKGKQGPYTDVYALCASMYAAITGKVPPPSLERSLEKVGLETITEQGVKVPERVEKAILHGLEVQRENRTQTMSDLYAEMYGAEPDHVPEDPNELIYQAGMKLMAADTPDGYKRALAQFEQIPGWKDAGDMAEICRKKLQGEAPTINKGRGSKPRKPEPKPGLKKWLIIPVLAVLAAAGFFLWRGMRQGQLNTAGTQTAIAETSTQSALELTADGQHTQTAQAGMTEQAAAVGTQTARETQEALRAEQTGTAWNLTVAAEYRQTQTQSAIEAGATQAEQEIRAEQTVQVETQAAMETAAAIQSEGTATSWFTTQEAQLNQTQTREAEEERETQAFFAMQTATQSAAEALEQTRVLAEQQTATQAAVEGLQTETAIAEQTRVMSEAQTATRAAMEGIRTETASAERIAVYEQTARALAMTQEAFEQREAAFHMMETEAAIAETQVAIDMRMTGVAATKTKAAEPTSTPTPEATATATATLTPTMTNTPEPTATPTKKPLRVGDIITFGRYEQDGDLSNGAEAIEWQVLVVEEGRALLISRYGLDAKPYNEKDVRVTWETCTLRAWLNGEFYSSAFSDEEKGRIRQVTVKNPDNAEYVTKGGNDTTDLIFLLSIEEAEQYFADDEARQCQPTTYAKNNRAYVSENYAGMTWWWLRSPGLTAHFAAGVSTDGGVRSLGDGVVNSDSAVRPAFWLNL